MVTPIHNTIPAVYLIAVSIGLGSCAHRVDAITFTTLDDPLAVDGTIGAASLAAVLLVFTIIHPGFSTTALLIRRYRIRWELKQAPWASLEAISLVAITTHQAVSTAFSTMALLTRPYPIRWHQTVLSRSASSEVTSLVTTATKLHLA